MKNCATYLQELSAKGVIGAQILSQCSHILQLSAEYDISLSPLLPVLLQAVSQPYILQQMLAVKFECIARQDLQHQWLDAAMRPEDDEVIMRAVRDEQLVPAEELQPSLPASATRLLGFELHPVEVLAARGHLPWSYLSEKLSSRGLTAQTGRPKMSFEVPSASMKAYPTFDSLAVESGLAAPNEISRCRFILDRLTREYGLKLPIERLLHEHLLWDRRWIAALLRIQVRQHLTQQIKLLARRRFTSQGDQLLEQHLKKQHNDSLTQAHQVQTTLKQWGCSFSLGEILVAMGALSDEFLESLEIADLLRTPWIQERMPVVKAAAGMPLGSILKENGLVSDEQLIHSLDCQKRCQESFGFSFALGEWLVARGYLKLHELLEALVAGENAQLEEKLDLALVKFSPAETELVLHQQTAQPPHLQAQYAKLKRELEHFKLNWSWADYLYLKGIIPLEQVQEVLARRHNVRATELHFPDWIYGETDEVDCTRLAVANQFINQETQEQLLAIKQYCAEQWQLELSPEQILLRKGLMPIEQLRALWRSKEQFEFYSHLLHQWQMLVALQGLLPEHEELLQQRIREYGLVSPGNWERSQRVAQRLQQIGVALSPLQVLLVSAGLPEWCYRDLVVFQSPTKVLMQVSFARDQVLRSSKGGATAPDWEKLSHPFLEEQFLGRLAVQNGLISPPLLTQALKLQQVLRQLGLYTRIGRLLIQMGVLTPLALQNLLDKQAQIRRQLDWPRVGLEGNDADSRSFRTISQQNLLGEIELKKCLYIVAQYRQAGISKSFYNVVTERGLLSEEVLKIFTTTRRDVRRPKTQTQIMTRPACLSARSTSRQKPPLPKRSTTKALPVVKRQKTPLAVEQRQKSSSAVKQRRKTPSAVKKVLRHPRPVRRVLCVLFLLPTVLGLWLAMATGLHVWQNRQLMALEKQKASTRRVLRVKRVVPQNKVDKSAVPVKIKCPYCNGRGQVPCRFHQANLRCWHGWIQVKVRGQWYYARKLIGTCPNCRGGIHSEACNGHYGPRIRCPRCGGKGQRKCPRCQGRGYLTGTALRQPSSGRGSRFLKSVHRQRSSGRTHYPQSVK